MTPETLLSEIKLKKLQQSMQKLIDNMESKNKRAAIGDLNFIIDKSIELKYLLKAELEEEVD